MRNFFKMLRELEPVAKALDLCQAQEPTTIAIQKELCAIEAPSNDESERGQRFAALLRETGIDSVALDEVGNVIGTLLGTDSNAPKVVLAAHLDTVFPRGTDCRVIEKDGLLYAPGIGDDTRGLAEVLTLARILICSGIRPRHTILFCGDVGEENRGNLRGCRHLFATRHDIGAFVSIDGSRCETLHYNAVGGGKLRVTYTGTGGHSMRMFGYPNCNNAAGRAVAKIAELQVPETPLTTFNVGILHGGEVTTAIPTEAMLEIDLRSLSEMELDSLFAQVEAVCLDACEEENRRWNHPTERVEVYIEITARRPGGTQSPDAPIVCAAKAAFAEMGLTPHIIQGASTDANIPISMGIPAVTIGRGGYLEYGHTTREVYHPKDAHIGVQRSLLLLLAISGVGDFRSLVL